MSISYVFFLHVLNKYNDTEIFISHLTFIIYFFFYICMYLCTYSVREDVLGSFFDVNLSLPFNSLILYDTCHYYY